MPHSPGLRDRKRAQTRERIADAAAALFAEHGYDAVSIADVGAAANVSDQTVYNYFPAKQDLVLDQAEEFRERYGRVVRSREAPASPARALHPLVIQDVERYRTTDLGLARGEFPAQSVDSAVLRRFALEERERQTRTIAGAITANNPEIPEIVVHTHAAALVAAIQVITDDIGTCVLNRAPQHESADAMLATAHLAFDHLDEAFGRLPGGETQQETPQPP